MVIFLVCLPSNVLFCIWQNIYKRDTDLIYFCMSLPFVLVTACSMDDKPSLELRGAGLESVISRFIEKLLKCMTVQNNWYSIYGELIRGFWAAWLCTAGCSYPCIRKPMSCSATWTLVFSRNLWNNISLKQYNLPTSCSIPPMPQKFYYLGTYMPFCTGESKIKHCLETFNTDSTSIVSESVPCYILMPYLSDSFCRLIIRSR